MCCIQILTDPKENTCFWYVIVHSYQGLEILQKKKKDLKELVKFAFYIKRVAHYGLSPKREKTCFLIWCTSIVISPIKFLRLC